MGCLKRIGGGVSLIFIPTNSSQCYLSLSVWCVCVCVGGGGVRSGREVGEGKGKDRHRG